MPAEFLVDEDHSVKIASYINGLRVESGLYPVIAQIFSKAVPLLNRVLTDLLQYRTKKRLPWPANFRWWDTAEDQAPNWEEESDEAYEQWENTRVPDPLPVPNFDPKDWSPDEKRMIDLGGHRLQVIAKLASMIIPEGGEASAGNWHVEVRGLLSNAHQ